jgi:predicted amidohydrolase YtcJ
VTHEYTLLLGATVLPGGGRAACEAIAWAHGIVLALGSDAEVRAISRGDSRVLEYPGAFVVPLAAPLEVGGPADLAVLARDPRAGGDGAERDPIAVLRAGRPSPTSAPGAG